jgi:hypothetical protein
VNTLLFVSSAASVNSMQSTFTGVYARGGPVQQGVGEGLDLSFMVNRLIPESAKRGAGSPSSPG